MQTACGIKDIDIIATQGGLGFGAAGDGDRVLALDDRQRVNTDLHAQNRQLFHRGGAVDVERAHQHPLAVAFLQPPRQFRGGGGFARALQADHQDRGRRVVDFQHAGVTVAGQHMDQLVMDDLDDLLAGGDGFGDGLPGGLFLHGGHEVAGDGEGNVGLQQRHPNLAQRGGHVGIGQGPLFGEPVKHAGQAFGEVFKHALRLLFIGTG